MSVVTLSVNESARGTATGGGTYDVGSQVTVTATSNSGYFFACWSDGIKIVSTNASYTFAVESDITLTALFYNEIDSVKIYGLCESNCKHRVLNVGQVISLIQEMAANGWQVPSNYIPSTAVNEIVDQNTGNPFKLFLGTVSEYNSWTGDKANTLFIPFDDTTVALLEEAITSVSDKVEAILSGETRVPKATNSTYAEYASADTSKGTIEQRLTNLGFREGSATVSLGSATQNNIKRQGNYCIFNLVLVFDGVYDMSSVATLPTGFRPKENVAMKVCAKNNYEMYVGVDVTISTDGTISVDEGDYTIYEVYLQNIGFEASPIA